MSLLYKIQQSADCHSIFQVYSTSIFREKRGWEIFRFTLLVLFVRNLILMLCSISDINKAGTLSIYEMNQDININDVIEYLFSKSNREFVIFALSKVPQAWFQENFCTEAINNNVIPVIPTCINTDLIQFILVLLLQIDFSKSLSLFGHINLPIIILN